MRIKTGFCLAFILGFLSLPSLASAYTAQALAQYQAGRQYQAAGQWTQAVRAYEAAMQADPSLIAAYKDLGTVYYQAGDHKGALYFYGRYLVSYPNDTATKNFVDSLRASLGAPTPAQNPEAAENTRNAGPFNPGFDVRGSLGGVMASGADVNEFYGWYTSSENPGGSFSAPGSVLATGVELGADYGFSGGFVVGLDLLYGPLRTDTASITGEADYNGGMETEKDTYTINQYAVLLTPGWRFKFGKAFVLEPRLGLGVMPASWTLSQNYTLNAAAVANGDTAASPASYSATGSGYAIWPELRGEYLFGQFGLGLSVGYLLNTNTEMRYTSSNPSGIVTTGNPVGYVSSPTATSTSLWYLNTSGFSASIYGVWHFQPLF